MTTNEIRTFLINYSPVLDESGRSIEYIYDLWDEKLAIMDESWIVPAVDLSFQLENDPKLGLDDKEFWSGAMSMLLGEIATKYPFGYLAYIQTVSLFDPPSLAVLSGLTDISGAVRPSTDSILVTKEDKNAARAIL